MDDNNIAQYIMLNEPAFSVDGTQYSICYVNGIYGTWDSNGNTFDFESIEALLENWMIDGKPFRSIVNPSLTREAMT